MNVIYENTKLHIKSVSKNIKCQYMKVSSTNVINVKTKIHIKAIWKHIQCLYIKKSCMTVVNVNTKLHKKVISKNIKCQYMRKSSILVTNVNTKLHKMSVSFEIKLDVSKFLRWFSKLLSWSHSKNMKILLSCPHSINMTMGILSPLEILIKNGDKMIFKTFVLSPLHKSELQRIVKMDQIRIPNIFIFENFPNTEYWIIRFLKMDRIPNTNSTIRSQIFEFRILNTKYGNLLDSCCPKYFLIC